MKNLFVLIVIVSAILISSCQKEITGITDPNIITNPGTFRAKIDGVQWEAMNIKTASKLAGVIAIYGSTTGDKSILLRVADSGVHNYTLTTQSMENIGILIDSSENTNSYTTNQWDTDSTYGNVNIVTIDTVNKTMSGTFKLKVYRQMDSAEHTITEGVFTNIIYEVAPPPPSGTDTFRVKVDGVDFTYNLLAGISAFGMVSISAAQTVAPAVGLSMPDNVVPGTYTYDGFEYVGQYNPSQTVFLAADTGSLTILEHNTTTKRIRGNFNFLANTAFTHEPPNVQLTEGYFSIVYQ
jgi:hypothetical protein